MTENEISLQLSHYKQLISISNDLASTLELDALLKRIAQAAVDLTGAESASILLYDERVNQLSFQATTIPNEPLLRGLNVPVDDSIAGWIVSHREPVIIDDVTKDQRYYEGVSESTGLVTKSLLGVPLIAKEKVNGALEAINKINGTFTPQDQVALMTLGTQAALAIENARLFQQFDLISEFIHEIRTPLSSLYTATHMLTHPDIDSYKRTRLAETIQRETHRLSEMSTNFLNIARLESGRTQFAIQSFDLAQLLNECVQLTSEDAEIRDLKLVSLYPQDIGELEADRDRIKQMILNLLSNAIKYNSPGGIVSLDTKSTPEEIQIIVADTGIGIPKEFMPKLFSKFFRVPGSERYAQGTGLGLSIVNRIIKGHGGHIDVESAVNKGTTFLIHLPKSPNQ